MTKKQTSLQQKSNLGLSPWLVTCGIEGLTPSKWLSLFDRFSISIDIFIQLSHSDYSELGLDDKQICQIHQAKSNIEKVEGWLSRDHNRFVTSYGDEDYPESLFQLKNPPLVLFGEGKSHYLSNPQVSVVGTRNPSLSGKNIATEFSRNLSELGITITSGLATGIDGAAHKGAIQGRGNTIAVVATGVDVCYPSRHRVLKEDILNAGGCIVSEFFLGTPARKYHFPQRNRIIAALSQGTLVVEAKIKSGSMITASLAADLGKEVMAVPSSIHNPLSEGCHHLIQQGAKLVTTVNDVAEEILPNAQEKFSANNIVGKKTEKDSLASDKILDSVDFDVTHIDIIAERTKLSVSEVMALLLDYELRGLVSAVPGGYIKLRA